VFFPRKIGDFRSSRKYARAQFMRAAKLDPTSALAFTYLGQFYRIVENNIEKAKRCYSKALSLDASIKIAGSYLFFSISLVSM